MRAVSNFGIPVILSEDDPVSGRKGLHPVAGSDQIFILQQFAARFSCQAYDLIDCVGIFAALTMRQPGSLHAAHFQITHIILNTIGDGLIPAG